MSNHRTRTWDHRRNKPLDPNLLPLGKKTALQNPSRKVHWRRLEDYLVAFAHWLCFPCLSQLARTSTNPTGSEVNDHVSLQWPSYEQPQDSNLRPQKEQTSWSQSLTTRPPPRWFSFSFYTFRFCFLGKCSSFLDFWVFFAYGIFLSFVNFLCICCWFMG